MKKSILFAALLCLPLCLMAEKKTKDDSKYLLGAVPEVEGVVTAHIALVYAEEGVMFVFSFTPCADEEAETAFFELMQFLAAQL